MTKLLVKKIECDTLVHRSVTEPSSVHVTNAKVLLLWHIEKSHYLAQLEVGMTAEELQLYQQLTTMITERVAKELDQ